VTCCLFHDDKYSFAHAGNTRLWLIRQGVIRQLTLDHTKAYRLFMDGIIDEEQYHTHPDNVVLTSGVGVVADPEVQIYEDAKLKEGDIVLLTTDGIHYSVRPDAMTDIIIDAKNCESAAASLVQAAVATRGMADNMSALLVFAVQGRKRA
jgi:protein phosphatase